MGSTDFMDAQPEIAATATALLDEGKIAPALPFPYHNLLVQPLKLIEDMNWALDANDDIVLFDLSKDRAFPDIVIRADAHYDSAIEQIKTPPEVRNRHGRPIIPRIRWKRIAPYPSRQESDRDQTTPTGPVSPLTKTQRTLCAISTPWSV